MEFSMLTRRYYSRWDILPAVLCACLACGATGEETEQVPLPEVVSFNAHIRPLMSNTCFVCHGPDEESNPAELRLDSFEAASGELPSGEGRAIVPGDATRSVVYQRIMAGADEQMPPADFRHQLSPRDKALFRRWIEQGAEYQQHWAYAPLERPPVPEIEAAENAIDAFILARLAEEGLSPSPSAKKAELLRRLSLDLIGLPPSPAELAAFLADGGPDAYERQVDRLLASPHYGERMASPWLDIVRFADTVGYHGDQNQRIFPYRDYVINAFSKNKPFDEFTREQLAGDLLPDPTEEQLTATGFTRLNMMTREGGAQPGEYLAKYAADRVRTIGTAWLGSTLGCCECHDHKYDPFSTKDFYSLGAFFADLRQWGVYTTYGYTPNPDLKGFNNESPFPPELFSQSESLNARIEYLQRESDLRLAEELPALAGDNADFAQWIAGLREFLSSHPDGWIVGTIADAKTEKGTPIEQRDDGSVLLSGAPQKDEVTTLEVQFPTTVALRALRLEVLPDEQNRGFVGRAKNGSFRAQVELLIQRGDEQQPTEAKVAWAQADLESPPKYRSGFAPLYLGPVWQSLPAAWQVPLDGAKRTHSAVYHFAELLQLGPDDRLVVRLKSANLGRVRLSATMLAEAIPGRPAIQDRLASALARSSSDAWPADELATLRGAYYRSVTPEASLCDTCKNFRRAIVECRAGYGHTLIAQSLPEEEIPTRRVLPRGNWQDKSGDVVLPNVPHFLPQPKQAEGGRLSRLDLANWLVAPENPLTARHFVNRLWKQFFGAGLSNKLDDLGNQGEWPSHPQLIDWLACEFRDSGWDVKRTIKLIVMSRTYQQRAAYRRDLSEVDPFNRLLAQQSARRLEAEQVRDNALAISGLLESELIGGPSVFPYQPAGYYANIQFPNRRYLNSSDDRQYRRGVYMHWQRTFLHPMLANFDAPARDECTADRTLSNSPQQALTLLNDPTFVEASRAMAQQLLDEMPDAEFATRLDRAFLLALCRPASDKERASLQQLYDTQLQYFAAQPDNALAFRHIGYLRRPTDAPAEQIAAWAQVCRVILNLHETITRY